MIFAGVERCRDWLEIFFKTPLYHKDPVEFRACVEGKGKSWGEAKMKRDRATERSGFYLKILKKRKKQAG